MRLLLTLLLLVGACSNPPEIQFSEKYDLDFTATGIAHAGTGYVIGDDGRKAMGDAHASAIVQTDAAFNVSRRVSMASLGFADPGSVQGVTAQPDGSVWLALHAPMALVHVSPGGVRLSLIAQEAKPNALAWDNGTLWVASFKSRTIRQLSLTGEELASVRVPFVPDQFFLEGRTLWITYGDNGTDGLVAPLDLTTMKVGRSVRLVGADAVEGIIVGVDRVLIVNDAKFHEGNPPLDRVLIYSRTDLERAVADVQ